MSSNGVTDEMVEAGLAGFLRCRPVYRVGMQADDILRQQLEAFVTAALGESYVVVPSWQPIETAPMDGTAILMVRFDQRLQEKPVPIAGAIGYWSKISEAWFSPACGSYLLPSHWQPVMAPPAMLSAAVGGEG